jgi:hypothetical protein
MSTNLSERRGGEELTGCDGHAGGEPGRLCCGGGCVGGSSR